MSCSCNLTILGQTQICAYTKLAVNRGESGSVHMEAVEKPEKPKDMLMNINFSYGSNEGKKRDQQRKKERDNEMVAIFNRLSNMYRRGDLSTRHRLALSAEEPHAVYLISP